MTKETRNTFYFLNMHRYLMAVEINIFCTVELMFCLICVWLKVKNFNLQNELVFYVTPSPSKKNAHLKA